MRPARAEIDELTNASVANRFHDRCLDARLRDVQRADVVPVVGMVGEITGGVLGARGARLGEPGAVACKGRVLGVDRGEKLSGQDARRPRLSEAEKRPSALSTALQQAGLDEELEMAGHARLRLAEDCDDLADGQLALGEQQQEAQPRLFGRGVERGEGGVEFQEFGGHRRSQMKHKDIYIR